MKGIIDLIKKSPHPEAVERFLEDFDKKLVDLLISKKKIRDFIFCIGASSYIAKNFIQNPAWVHDIFLDHELYEDVKLEINKGEPFVESLVKAWRKEHIKIGARDLLAICDLPEILRQLSVLADVTIDKVCRYVFSKVEAKFGKCDIPYAVIALGKLGGEELNFYSDIDIMYLYERNSSKIGNITVHEFFTRFFTEITKVLSSYTKYGKLYNVDLRLRPQGRKGLIALPLEGYEIYYQSFGRTWERAVLIKARRSAGDESLFNEFMEIVRPFVFRKYLDFSAIEEIRALKTMIDEEEKKSRGINVKTGRGGIREIEFVVQALQLAFGGKEPWIREGNTLIALHRIYTKGLLGAAEYNVLAKAYLFLRKLENRLQLVNCAQTHVIPEKKDELRRIVYAMGFVDEDGIDRFWQEFTTHTQGVREIFEAFLSEKKASFQSLPSYSAEFESPSEFERCINILINGKPGSPLPEPVKLIAHEVIDDIVKEASKTANPLMVLKNLVEFVEIMKHSKLTFYTLLRENPNFRRVLITLFGNSQFLTRLLMVQPELLDFLFEEGLLGKSSPLKEMIETIMDETELMSYQDKLNYLRRFKQGSTIRIGMSDIMEVYTLTRVFYEWSKLADTVIIVLHHWLKEFIREGDISIIALGKLGGREITYHSDLDIIFIGDREQTYYVDYYTRFIRALTLQSAYGNLFEVDTRLRPFGSKGVMVNTPDSLYKYFKKYGRTWERMAFSKFRIIWGNENADFLKKTKDVVEEFVYGSPNNTLEKDVWDMRLKIEDELGKSKSNIKYSEGGLVDVEFIAQYLNIKHRLMKNSTLSSLCAAKRKDVIDYDVYTKLRNNYLFLRKIENICRLVFYPPLKELPLEGTKARMISKVMGVSLGVLLERFWKVKEENRAILKEILEA